jgi:heavy metal translocating P-type ATPase
MTWLKSPQREYAAIAFLAVAFVVDLTVPSAGWLLLVVSAVAVLPTIGRALAALWKKRVNIDTFNTFAIVISFLTGETRSAGFIALMLSFAALLDQFTESRTKRAIEELMKLKPQTALRLRGDDREEVPVGEVRTGEVVLVESGARVPVDGVIIFGTALMNEASVTGESVPVEKSVGERVLSATLAESGVIKVRATSVGKDSTIERMVALMTEAGKHKSHAEKLADRFAGIFLPIVAAVGIITYLVTRNLTMVAALFLVACADDMAVAIPLAMTASLGAAARRGVAVKGGEWLDVLGRMRTLVLDKTGTLTYGSLRVKEATLAPGTDADLFWWMVGTAEKFSEHPVGRALFREARTHLSETPDPDEVRVVPGGGVWVRAGKHEAAIGNERLVAELGYAVPAEVAAEAALLTAPLVFIDRAYAGRITVSDVARPEAAESLRRLRAAGVRRIIMFTGDREEVAQSVAAALGITEYRAGMQPEDKLRELETALKDGPLGMVGDGVNDAPALARADVGIAMGTGGTAVAVEAADVVILTDDLSRLPEMVELGRRTSGVIRGDMLIWFLSNVVGFALVLTGVAGPAFAAFYNFITDFFPLLNSSRLFRASRDRGTLRS